MERKQILEPLSMYNNEFKEAHHNKTIEYFDSLVEKSELNIEENRKTIKELNAERKRLSEASNKLGFAKALKILNLVASVAFILIGAYLLYTSIPVIASGSTTVAIVQLIIGIVLIILSLIFIFFFNKKIKNMINKRKAEVDEINSKVQKLEADAANQMAKINSLYDWNMAAYIAEEVTPLIDLDMIFDSGKMAYLKQKYNFSGNSNPKVSTLYSQSGNIMGNPFILVKNYNNYIGDKTYTGSITIHWTTTERDSKGNSRTVHHSQVLTASVTKPWPGYYVSTELLYFNDAAPNLSFSRGKSGTLGKSEKTINKMIEKETKEFEKKARKAVSKGGDFTKMTNDDFESLFGAENRDNEVEFRLLFTPLAQQNMEKLIRNQVPFGDDFSFTKKKQMNIIRSDHSQGFEYNQDPGYFKSISYDEARERFIAYNEDYFRRLFFDFAPLLAIPLYQQHQPVEQIYGDIVDGNFSAFEHETLANKLDMKELCPKDAITDIILKTKLVEAGKESDKVEVRAHSYRGVNRVDMIPRHGGDGRTHMVPVNWVEYIPVYKDTIIDVARFNSSATTFKDDIADDEISSFIKPYSASKIAYERGLMSFIVGDSFNKDELNKLDEIVKKRGK